MGLEQAWLALIGAIMGTSGLKLVEHILNRASTKNDMAASMRAELREEIKALKEDLDEAQKDLDEWRSKYWELMGQFVDVRNQLQVALLQIEGQAKQAKKAINEFPEDPTN